MFGKPRRVYTHKLTWDEGIEALRRLEAGQSVEKVARRFRREPEFIAAMLAYRKQYDFSISGPYIDRIPCSRARAAAAEARQLRYLAPRLISTIRYWIWELRRR